MVIVVLVCELMMSMVVLCDLRACSDTIHAIFDRY